MLSSQVCEVEECVQQCSGVLPISHHWRARSGREGVVRSGEWRADRRATGIREVTDELEGAEQPEDAEWPGKRRTTMRMPSCQEDLSGKYPTDQPGQSWVTVRAPNLQDIQLGTGHEGDE